MEESFIILLTLSSKIIFAFATRTIAESGVIFILISCFLFLWITPLGGSKIYPSEFSTLYKMDMLDLFSRVKRRMDSFFTVIKLRLPFNAC